MIFNWLSTFSTPDLIIEISLLLLVIFPPLAKGTFNGWPVMVVHILCFTMLISWIIKMSGQRSWSLRKTPVDYPLIFFFIIAVISCIFSLDYGKSMSGVLKILDCLVIFYVAANNLDTKIKIKVLLYAAIFVGGFLSLFGLIQLLGGIGHSWWVLPFELSATFENSNYFAGFIALIIPLAIGISLDDLEPGQRIIIYYLLALMTLAFILSLSRGGWISLAAAMAAMSLLFFGAGFNKESINKKLLALLSLLFVVSIFMLSICLGFTNILGKMDGKNFCGRIKLWKYSLSIIKDYPLTGTGIDVFTSFDSAIPAGFKNVDSEYMRFIKKNALSSYYGYDGLELCNQYLQIAAEMGILGLLCFIWLIIKGIFESLKVYKQHQSKSRYMVCLGIIGVEIATVVHMLSSNLLNFMSISVLLSLLMGILFSTW